MTHQEHYARFKQRMASAETDINIAHWQAHYAIEALTKENNELRKRVAELEGKTNDTDS